MSRDANRSRSRGWGVRRSCVARLCSRRSSPRPPGSIEIASLSMEERLKHQTDLTFPLSIAARQSLRAMRADIEPRDRQPLHKALTPIVADDQHRAWARASRALRRSAS